VTSLHLHVLPGADGAAFRAVDSRLRPELQHGRWASS
jgi:hypothetical protein